VNRKAQPPLSERQIKEGAEEPSRAWISYLWYLRPGPLIDLLRKHLRSQGRELALDQADLRTQLAAKPYFVAGPRQGHQQKFEAGSRANRSCLCVDLDAFLELGFRAVTDEEWESSFHWDGDLTKGRLPLEEWMDPRKGDLFALVEALTGKDENEN